MIIASAMMGTTTLRYFACPFYVRNTEVHRACLARAGLRSIDDVKKHLWELHRQPYYCPVCYEVFNTAGTCSDHIREQTCQLRTGPAFEGVSDHQMHQLACRSDTSQSKEEQWFAIWDTIFYRVKRPIRPYLSSDPSDICRALS